MAFQGTISPAPTHTLLIDSPVPMYWKARTYDTYTGKGWISEHTEYKPVDYTPEFVRTETAAGASQHHLCGHAPVPFEIPVRGAAG